MIPELEALKSEDLPDFLVEHASQFIKSGDPAIPRGIGSFPTEWNFEFIGRSLVDKIPWNENSVKLLRFFVFLSDGAAPTDEASHKFLFGIIRHLHGDEISVDSDLVSQVTEEIEAHYSDLDSYVFWYFSQYTYRNNWALSDKRDSDAPFASPVANLLLRHLGDQVTQSPEVLTQQSGLFAVLATQRPDLTKAWIAHASKMKTWHATAVWLEIIQASSAYDDECLSYCDGVVPENAADQFSIMRKLVELRNGKHFDKLLEVAAIPQAALGHETLEFLFQHRADEVLSIMTEAFAIPDAGQHTSDHEGAAYKKLYDLMLRDWNQGGSELLVNVIDNFNDYRFASLLTEILPPLTSVHLPALRTGFLRRVERTKTRERAELWQLASTLYPQAFGPDFEELVSGGSKPLRKIASIALSNVHGQNFIPLATELLSAKNSNARQGGAMFFEALSDPSTQSVLESALETEQAGGVRDALHAALKACGAEVDPTHTGMTEQKFNLETFTADLPKGLKLPKAQWLDLNNLTPLHFSGGSTVPEPVITFLISKQAKQKAIEAAPDIVPLLAQIDRGKSAPFAAALVEGFLNSEQAAADRWAITLGGLLGDKRIINLLLPRIQGWCENSRHKLAEYAAQAISLLPGDEPLMVLDTLANRYRTKFKNIGRACSEAFTAAATARGITPDELGDMVVPDFGFDEEGVRRFDWEGGGISAELGADFKLTWFDPETEKSWKSLPAGAPEETKAEVKTVTKLIRETVKAQTARLEMSLVRQRRWSVSRWQELFENHPLLRSFASGLVWGLYDVSGNLLRTFRRYPNGILADAAGAMEELAENDSSMGMVHPLELDQSSIDLWRAHFQRMKAKQPFPQIDRPVELLDPLHGNRREISLTKDRELSAGTFRSRAEKRGWTRGSVIDAGGIASYYKLYPGAGVEVNLPTEDFWVGIEPMDTITLGPACFAKAGTIERGSYIYNEPEPDDPRVLRFDQVPPVVFSETISDLKAIIATKE